MKDFNRVGDERKEILEERREVWFEVRVGEVSIRAFIGGMVGFWVMRRF